MIGYVLPGAPTAPETVENDPRAKRLLRAGPWQVQPHQAGCLMTWAGAGPRPLTEFGPSRKTDDGMLYFPPKVLPNPMSLLREGFAQRTDAHRVQVETGEGGMAVLLIVPAYASPRKILEDNSLGDFATAFARKTLNLLGQMSDKKTGEDSPIEDFSAQVFDICREAIMHTTRCTKELIADCGWITENSALPIWRAITHVPKAAPEPGSAPSALSAPAAV